MAGRPRRVFFVPLMVAVALISLASASEALSPPRVRPGGFGPITDPKEPHIQGLALYAIRAKRRETGEALTLTRVLGGQQQVVTGMNYRLVIGAAPSLNMTVESLYLARVYEKSWENYRNLDNFELIV
ncbi:cysteine proteinase inhibitor 8-like [Wolffia australiana]